ncbi:MAG: hopanoid biosynthesis-associated protein HpnK [Sphingomonadaceae bacterium]|nr:hopanoid biosynthesis-associated protein HpnK [Sphingomonadaceae bacterium]
MSARRLIVTSDDFGAALAVNEAVEQAHRNGILTAASLMVSGDACADAIARAKTMPKLGVGLHLVLVDGRPILSPDEVPDLVGADGRFRDDMVAAAFNILRPRGRRQLAREIEAQFATFAATGLPLDHVNAHKHFHLHPMIADLILAAGRRHGLQGARAPIEPAALIAAIDGRPQPLAARATAQWARLIGAELRNAGALVPDRVIGLAWSGAMTRERLAAILERLPPGLSEVYLHPATDDTYPGHAPGYRYRDELAALIDPGMRTSIAERDIELGSFADFAKPVSRGVTA